METTIPIPFPFPLQDNENADIDERVAFWDSPSTVEWFRDRGYALYVHNDLARDQPWYSEPTLACEHSCEMQYPYSHYGSEESMKAPLRATDSTGKIAYAQEIYDPSHHVAIKLIRTVLFPSWTFSRMVPSPSRSCQGKWGGVVYSPMGGPIRSVVRIMHSLLKALAFLHRNNILHRDIKFDNVLVSHFADDATLYNDNSARGMLQWSDQLSYCLFDFDISMMLPADTDRVRCRLSYKLSWDGSGRQPHDTMQGEFDYNPFAYDVGTLGRVLCVRYQHLTLQIPMLAPFLDRMVTRNIPLRFNALEALQFFEAILPEIPESVMNAVYHEKTKPSDYEWDRWEGLPPEFVQKWMDILVRENALHSPCRTPLLFSNYLDTFAD
ncbi:hypothetical protein AGABI1DRAFT_130182 [Agaricus bisporus var. burnettii JB137-S8]|uniref:Protein kinase domain-containing protein n=1 Tax=Agaricus bisporus var. burnettii (strain JB137-S8 / ATCC MYA-4627 / FGSC 10392) TaxID=597362 RepID=K5WQ49_AGABU|nr:uncharacterized protein AGABI1DRAFT_130182 [Agaricus bisporus var. burnettii JB137-S8]EKM77481.1 hypothetical protein AGABI1DRAFT_130182 [Agaricus bisporus var. burnettii JB137-S8]